MALFKARKTLKQALMDSKDMSADEAKSVLQAADDRIKRSQPDDPAPSPRS